MLATMLRRLSLVALTFPLLALAYHLQVLGQVSAVTATDARPEPEILIEAKVLGIPAALVGELGLVLPESASGVSGSPTGFAVILPEDEAKGLLQDSRTNAVHTLKLQGTPGNALKFRVDTRVPANANSTSDNPPYFEVGMAFEVTPAAFPSRNIALATASTLQIRRGPGPADGVVPLVFETQPIKHDIQIPEGKTILLGGFLTDANSKGLPVVPAIAGNPILDYVVSKSPRKGNETEIVVLLTPRLSGVRDDVPKPAITRVEPPAASNTPVLVSDSPTKLDLPPVSVNPPVTAMPPIATPAPAPVRAPAPQVESRFYSVQVGAFGSSPNAEALAAELKKKFEAVFVDKAPSGRTPYRVRVGKVSSFAAARQIQTKLMEAGFGAFVVPPDSN
jgi:cell division septation protein DedD